MSKGVLRKYAPFYVAIIVTAVVTTLLFLSPDEAVGLSLVVNQPANDRNSESGFKILDPSTGLPETVVIKSEVRFDGGTEVAPSAAVDIIRENGAAGFIDVTALPIPVRPATGEALTVAQGTLLVDVVLEGIKKFPVGAGFAYGYDGLTQTGGLIQITLRYTPPPINRGLQSNNNHRNFRPDPDIRL